MRTPSRRHGSDLERELLTPGSLANWAIFGAVWAVTVAMLVLLASL